MAKQTINLGTSPNDGTGDKLRTAFTKINQNFDEIYVSGVIGAQGSRGVQGTIGVQGQDGVIGPIGEQGLIGPVGLTGSPGVQGTIGVQGVQGTIGVQGIQGSKGEAGSFGGASFNFNYITNTEFSDPTLGKLKFNDVNLTTATEMYIDDASDNSIDIQTYLRTIDESTSGIKGNFRISELSNVDAYVFYAINDVVEDDGYFAISCGKISNTIETLPNNTPIVITFARVGDKGDTGQTGAPGVQGSQGVQGAIGTGTQGPVGIQGPPGTGSGSGAQGPIGVSGVQGSPGSVGAPGEGGNISYELLKNFTLSTGTVTHDCDNGNNTVFVHSQIEANITANFINVGLIANSAIGLTIIVNQGGTAYLPTAVQLSGQSQTINWLDGISPTGNPNKKDIIAYNIINQNGTTNTVFASLATFG
jgi:hypothetical protein